MSTTFQRSPLTAYMRAWFEEKTKFPCGDAVIPQNSGWRGTEPNAPASIFEPYSVLTTMTAVPAPNTGSIGTGQEDWHIPYLIQTFGITREQTERLADRTRVLLGTLEKTILDLSTNDAPNQRYKVELLETNTIGAVNVTPGSDPMFYGEQDQFTMWLAKRRT